MRSLFAAFLVLLQFSVNSLAEGFSGKQIQQFIDDAIAAGGGEVVLPQGRHRLSEPLVIKDASKLRVIGLDAEDTHLLPATGIEKPFPLLVIEGKTEGVRIAKLTFTTGDSAIDFAGHPLIQIRGTATAPASVEIDRCLFEKHGGSGVVLEQVKGSSIKASTFMDLGGSAIQVTDETSSMVIQHNHIIRSGGPAIDAGSGEGLVEQIANEVIVPTP